MSKNKTDKIANEAKKQMLNPEGVKKDKKKKAKRILAIIVLLILSVVLLCIATFMIVRAVGKQKLSEAVVVTAPTIADAVYADAVTQEEEETTVWKEGWVKYQGTIYEYNEDIRTFLFMGIDKNTDAVEVSEGTNGGQADALFLLILNPKTESINLLAINRNTITNIDRYDENGAYIDTILAQIAVQHGFGNGVEESCERQVKAVDQIIYNMPIHGYFAINMKAISTINDMVGGVEVTAIEDVTDGKSILVHEGDTLTLMGDDAYFYVRDRNEDVFGSADMRLARQKQYLNVLLRNAITNVKANPGFALELYNAIADQTVTSVTASEVTYMASTYAGYGFDMNNIYTTPGETVQGEKFEEFYLDEQAMYEKILNLYYEPVGEY